jgi:hypothetical protein
MGMTRLALCGVALALAVGTATPVLAQASLDTETAQEFLALELAGWRLPDPVEECLTRLTLRRLEPMAYGSEDLIDQPELVDPPGPHFRILRVEPDSGNRQRRVVQFEWLIRGPGGAPRTIRDTFTFLSGGDPARGGGRPIMQREPDHMVIRRECFGG